MTHPDRYRIADLTLDIARKELFRGGRRVELSKLNFEVLAALVEAAPALVSKQDLARLVWHGRHVSAETIGQRVKLLRSALGDSARGPRYVEVIRGQGYRLVPAVTRTIPERRKYTVPSLVAAACTAAIVLAIGLTDRESEPEPLDIDSDSRRIAVLPFDDVSPAPEYAFYAAGIHADLVNRLARIPELSVISRTAVMRYSDFETSLSDIGRELGVSRIVEGSVGYFDERIRIQAQLVDTASGVTLWSDEFERETSEILSIQDDLAEQIAPLVAGRILLDTGEQPIRRPTDSPEAFVAYLKALDSFDTLTTRIFAVRQTLGHLDRALALDAEFAEAYALRAATAVTALQIPSITRPGWSEMVRESADRALAIDPRLASAHASLAAMYEYERNLTKAHESFERALALDPEDARIHVAYSGFLSVSEDHQAALRHAREALALDPHGADAHERAVETLLAIKDVESAVRVSLKASVLHPSDANLQLQLALVEIVRGNTDEAYRLVRIAEQLVERPTPNILARIAYAYGRLGYADKAEDLVASLKAQRNAAGFGSRLRAVMGLALGDDAAALASLHAASGGATPGSRAMADLLLNNLYSDPLLSTGSFVAARRGLGIAQ